MMDDSPTEITFNLALIYCMGIWAIAYILGKILNQRNQ